MTIELKKRILTSFFLLFLLVISFFNNFVLIILLILLSVFSWIEFNGLVYKIFTLNKKKSKILKSIISAIFFIYLIYFSTVIFSSLQQATPNLKSNMVYLLLICIFSDIGGYIIGKTLKGKKLTSISPNKTISGSIGSFIFPLFLAPIFFYLSLEKFNLLNLIILTIFISLICQLGDLFISLLKRKANVKDTGNILPGHGGILDRLDGIFIGVPFGFLIFILFY